MPKVDFSHYQGREQAYIKHCLLEEYLPEWAYKVGSVWDSLAYIDGFAGPWQTTSPNYEDSSFGIAVNTLRNCQIGLQQSRQRDLQMDCILVDQNSVAFSHLSEFALQQNAPNFGVHALRGEFVENIPAIEKIVRPKSFRFVFLDPKGWSDIPMLKLKPFLQSRSCEVLINLMTRHIIRFLDEPDRETSYNDLFGRDEVLKNLRTAVARKVQPHERAAQAVFEYGQSLRLLCGFRYVSSAVVLEPDEESIRYFLVYASNHHRGVEVFKAAETKASKIQDEVRHETLINKTGQASLMFDSAPPSSPLSAQLKRYFLKMARDVVREKLLSGAVGTKIPYSSLFCESMAFPLVTPTDLQDWLRAWTPAITLISEKKKRSPKGDDYILLVNPKLITPDT